MFIKAQNYDVSDKVRTNISSAAAAAAGTLTCKNTTGFAADDYIVVGKSGTENAEIQQVSAVTDVNTLTLAGTLNFPHASDTPIYFIKYNQVRFYLGDTSGGYSTGTIAVTHGSTTVTGTSTVWTGLDTTYSLNINGKFYDIASIDSATQITLTKAFEEESYTSGTYIAIPFTAQTTKTAEIDREHTSWDDTDGIASDYYRVAYVNGTTSDISALSDVISAGGTDKGAVRKLIEDIRIQTGEREGNSSSFSNDEIMSILDEAQEDVWSKSKKLWWWNSDFSLTTIADKISYDLPDDFFALLSIRGYDGTTYTTELTELSYQELSEIRANDTTTSDTFVYYAIWGGRIYIYPTPDSGVTSALKILYQTKPLELSSGGTISNIPESRVLKYYAIAKIFEIKNDLSRFDRMQKQYEEARDRMIGTALRNRANSQMFKYNPNYNHRITR